MNGSRPGIGDVLPERVIERVDTEKMKTMAAILRDPNPIHLDAQAVRKAGLGDAVINQGPTNMGYLMDMLIAYAGGEPGRLRSFSVRFRANVYGGDRVVAGGTVTGVREEAGETLADCEVWLERRAEGAEPDASARVLTGSATVALPGTPA